MGKPGSSPRTGYHSEPLGGLSTVRCQQGVPKASDISPSLLGMCGIFSHLNVNCGQLTSQKHFEDDIVHIKGLFPQLQAMRQDRMGEDCGGDSVSAGQEFLGQRSPERGS